MQSLPLLLLFAAAPAFAGSGAFGVKTMREPYSNHEVERGLLLSKGWLQLSLAYDQHNGVGQWTPEGDIKKWDTARWSFMTERATVAYGLGHQWEVWWSVPFHEARLVNDALGTDTRDHSLGDPRIGLKYEIIDHDPPEAIGSNTPVPPRKSSLALEFEYKGPAGKESPGTYIGGPLNMSGFLFSTGTPDADLSLLGRQQLGPIALTGNIGWTHRFSAVVQYLIETENLQFAGRMKPGDQMHLSGNVQVQAGPIVPFATISAVHRNVTRTGTTAGFPRPNANLETVDGSDGTSVDLDAGLLVDVSRGVDLRVHYTLPLMGQDLQFFPLEDLQPTYGPTLGGSLIVRY